MADDEIPVVHERIEPVDGIHMIYVPEGWSVEQAWEAICRGEGVPASGQMHSAVIEVKDGKYVKTIPPEVLAEFGDSDEEETERLATDEELRQLLEGGDEPPAD